ncbi:uncharacterized protein LOC135499432 [Lineus longissimus]|uniref:uncharacterized protein LOC135499432 n=1 Tax=Lineus longissimus TaxID=88925 RepID=UPI00315D3D52
MVIKQNRQILMLSLMGKAMDGVARQLTRDVKRFIWHEGENEIIQSSSEEETEEPIIETEDPVKKRKPKVPKKKVGFQVVQPTPLKTEKRIAEGAALIEEEEVEEEDEEVDDIHELLRMIATEKWFPRGKEISPENTLEVLMRLLERASTPIRRDVMKYIGEFYRTFGLAADKKGQIITTLQGLLQHENVFIRVGAVKLLGELGLARRDIILGLLPMLVHEEPELRGTAVATFRKLTGVMNKDGLLHLLTDLGVIGRQEDGYLIEDAALQILANNLGQGECDTRNDSVTLGEDGGASPSTALPILSKNRGLREDRASHSIVVNGTFSDLIESWVNGLDSSQRDDLYDPLAKASHTEGFGPDGQPLSATSSFESVGASPREPDLGDDKGKKRMAPDRSMTVCVSGQDAAAAAAVDRTSGSISSSPKVTLLDRSTDSLNAARRGIIGPLEAAESRKRVRRQRRSESKATDNTSIDGSTTSMSGAGFSGTHDFSDQKQKRRKDSLGRLAESYRQKSQDALDKKQRKDSLGRLAQTYRKKSLGLQGSKTQSSAERSSIKGSKYRQNSQEFMKLRRQNSADGTSMKDSLYRQNSQEVLRSRGENSTDGTSMKDSLYRQNSQEVLRSRRQNSAESVDSFEKGRKGEDRDSDIYSASFGLGSQLLDDGRSQKTGQTGVGLKSDDSGIGQFSDSDSHMTEARDKYGRNLAGSFAPPMSPVSDGTVELEQGEPNWRQLFDDPLTIEGLPHMEQRRVNADQLRRTTDAMNARHSINFPPIRYLGENEKLLPGEAGQRLLHSIQVKAGPGKSPDSKSKWYRIDAIPGRLGLHTSTEDSGTSKFGILKMKWTTDMPHYDPYAYQKLPLGYYTIPGGTLPKIQKASQTRNIPIARPTSPGTKLTSLPFIDVPIPISKARYEWDRPMPPAPPRRSRMDLPIIRTEHDRYCQYYKIAKEKEEERKQEAMKLPTITPTRSGTLGVVPSPASSHQQSPRELEELELPPITAGMILGAEC